MNKKLVLVAVLMVTTLTLPACKKSVSNVSNLKASETSSTQGSKNSTLNKKLNLNSNKDLTNFAKEKTSKFYKLLQKNKIDGVVTPDNMYAVNTQQKIEKYNRNYNFCTEYKVNPNLDTGNGAGIMTLYLEKNIDDTFSKDDDKVKFINDAINQLTSIDKINIDDFIKKLNKADNNAKNDPSKKCVISLDKDNIISITIFYNEDKSKNVTQLLIKYAEPFKNYTFNDRKKYNTVKEFEDNESKQKQVEDFLKKYGDTQKDGSSSTKVSFNGGSFEIESSCDSRADCGFADYYSITGGINEYDINNPSKGNEKLKVIYDFMKTFTLNNKLSQDDFDNYIKSSLIYDTYKYDSKKFYMNSEGESEKNLYYMPFANIQKNILDNGSEPWFYISFIDTNNSTKVSQGIAPLKLRINFKVPVIAEGKTRE
ncbi:hypothetical protein OSC52_13560 [Clostridium pasteurianum]|uniref:hypothetical protein n=1 Tax=Clostridium pasteurianum TaxID=1501 RepID=UPI002260A3DC|nr:hypothetical protein [Clostridium pasteurianum]UZW12876.1 hypothetical protein OSC52_13560 [Clostridium pasteurianum]